MTTKADLIAKKGKVEALFAGAATAGERDAAQAAMDRIKAKLRHLEGLREAPTQMVFSLGDGRSKSLFLALCRRHGLKLGHPSKHKGNNVTVWVAHRFADKTLWPEFCRLGDALESFLDEATEQYIRERVTKGKVDPEEGRGPS